MRAKVWKETACTARRVEKRTSRVRAKLGPAPDSFFAFGAGASLAAGALASVFFAVLKDGNEMDGALKLGKDGALMDGTFGIEGDASCFVFFGAAGVDLVCCSANKSLASDFVSPLAT